MGKSQESEIMKLLGDQEQMIEELRHFGDDTDFFASVYDKLIQEYPNHWVAVFRGAVVGVEETPEKLFESLRAKQIPAARAVVAKLLPDNITLTV